MMIHHVIFMLYLDGWLYKIWWISELLLLDEDNACFRIKLMMFDESYSNCCLYKIIKIKQEYDIDRSYQ